MKVVTSKGKTEIVFTDAQLGHLMSLLAVGVVKFDEFKDPEVSTTKEDLLELSKHIIDNFEIVIEKQE